MFITLCCRGKRSKSYIITKKSVHLDADFVQLLFVIAMFKVSVQLLLNSILSWPQKEYE